MLMTTTTLIKARIGIRTLLTNICNIIRVEARGEGCARIYLFLINNITPLILLYCLLSYLGGKMFVKKEYKATKAGYYLLY